MFENFCLYIIQSTKCFALESFNSSCQMEHNKIQQPIKFEPWVNVNRLLNNRPLNNKLYYSREHFQDDVDRPPAIMNRFTSPQTLQFS